LEPDAVIVAESALVCVGVPVALVDTLANTLANLLADLLADVLAETDELRGGADIDGVGATDGDTEGLAAATTMVTSETVPPSVKTDVE
jgi:hypothetical protein